MTRDEIQAKVDELCDYDKESNGKFEWVWCISKCRLCEHEQVNVIPHLANLQKIECNACGRMTSSSTSSYIANSKEEIIEMMWECFGDKDEDKKISDT